MKRFCTLSAAAWALATLVPVAAQTDGPAAWAPADALFYVGVTDLDKAWANFQKTNSYALMKDPIAKESFGELHVAEKLLEAIKKRIGQALDVEPERLKNPFGGGLAFYGWLPPGEKTEALELVLVAQAGDMERLRDYHRSAVRKLRDHADSYDSVSAGANTIDVFVTKATGEQADKDEWAELEDESFGMEGDEFAGMIPDWVKKRFSAEGIPEELALCLTEDRLIAARSADEIKRVLRRGRGAEGLAGSEDYRALLRQFKPAGSVRFLVNIPRLVELARAEGDSNLRDFLDASGAADVRSLIGHLRVGAAEFESKMEILLMMGGRRTGLAKILSMENRDIVPPDSVPADATFYASLNLDVLAVVGEVERMIRKSDPDAADRMRAGLEQFPTPGGEMIDLRKDLLEQLQAPATFHLLFNRPYDPDSIRMLLTLGHRKQNAIEKLLGIIPMFVAREVRGTQIFDFMFGGISVAPTSDAILAGNTAAVETALQPAAGDGLAESAAFRRARRLAPREAWGVIYADERRMMEAMFGLVRHRDALQAASFSNPIAGIVWSMLQGAAPGLDAEKADGARKLLRYYGSSIATLATTPEGILFTQIKLKPQKE